MTKVCSGDSWSVFVEAKIPVTVISLTRGELGINTSDHETTPSQMGKIRAAEFHSAVLPVERILLDFPDLALSIIPRDVVVRSLLEIVRAGSYAALFSFHPVEYTPMFDHPDHHTAGEVTSVVSAACDVRWFEQDIPSTVQRPELWLWSTQAMLATHELSLSNASLKRRDQYLLDSYPSQFSLQSAHVWKKIFSTITRKGRHHREWYTKVR